MKFSPCIRALTATVFSVLFTFIFPHISHTAPEVTSITPSSGMPGSGIVIMGTDLPEDAKAALYGGPATFLGSYTDGAISGVTAAGTYAYGAAGGNFRIIDIGNPANPHLAGSCSMGSTGISMGAVAVGGGYGCAVGGRYDGSDWVGRLEVVNVSDPANPYVEGGCDLPEYARDVAVVGTHALVADGWSGLQVVDFGDPSDPYIVDAYDLSGFGFASALTVVGSEAYVVCHDTICKFNVLDPASPQFTGGCWLGWCEVFPWVICYELGHANDVAVYHTNAPFGEYLCLAYSGGLMMIDITNGLPNDLTAGHYYTVWMSQAPTSIAVGDGLAYLGCGSQGVKVVDISDKNRLRLVGACNTPGGTSDIFLTGPLPLVGSGDSGLQVLAPWRPLEGLGYLDSTSLAATIPMDQNPGLWNLWVADYSYPGGSSFLENAFTVTAPPGLDAVVPSSAPPGTPLTIDGADFLPGAQIAFDAGRENIYTAGACPTPGNQYDVAHDVAVAGTHAYVANGSTFKVIDISTPSAPSVIGGCDATAAAVAVRGVFAYTVGYPNVFQVIDIRDPSAPSVIGDCNTADAAWAHGVAVSGDYAYVADGSKGLTAISIKDPRNPRRRGSCDTFGNATDVAVAGDYAYVASGNYGLWVIDITTRDDPVYRNWVDTPGTASGIAVSGGRAYVADGATGLQVLDVSDPFHPSPMDACETPGTAVDVAVMGHYAYVADGDSGVQVIDIDPGSVTYLTIVGDLDTPDTANGIVLHGLHAYVADRASGLQVLGLFGSQPPTVYLDQGTLTTHVASWLSFGIYDLYVANPDGGLGILEDAFVVTPICDLTSFAAAYGSLNDDDEYNFGCDLDEDEDVDGNDLAIFSHHFSTVPSIP